MKAKINGNVLTVTKETGDKNYYGTANGAGESNFLHALKEHLNSLGFELIKKRMWKDGHMMDDLQQYLRTNNKKSKTPHIYLWNGKWAIKGLNDDWNKYGEVDLNIDFDVYECQPNCKELMAALLEKEAEPSYC